MSEGPAPPTVHDRGTPGGHASPPPDPPAWLDAVLLDSTVRGIVIALLAPFVGFGVAASCLIVPVVGQVLCMVFGLAPGLAQLAWIIPLDRWADRHGRFELKKGLRIGASVVFLLNGSCWGYLGVSSLSSWR